MREKESARGEWECPHAGGWRQGAGWRTQKKVSKPPDGKSAAALLIFWSSGADSGAAVAGMTVTTVTPVSVLSV